MANKDYKVYVDVIVKHKKDGSKRPLTIEWIDGRTYEIAKVKDVRPAASLKAGGAGIRYTVIIDNKETYLFLEEDRWFVESKE